MRSPPRRRPATGPTPIGDGGAPRSQDDGIEGWDWAHRSLAADHERLHCDRAALASLLVPTPSADLVREIRSIVETHNATEEGTPGVCAACDALAEEEVQDLVKGMRVYPPVKLAPHVNGPGALRTAADALRAVGKRRE